MTKVIMPVISLAALNTALPACVLSAPRMDAAEPGTEEMLKTISAQLKIVSDDVKQTAETAMKEAKNSGVVAAETKAAADKLLTEQSVINKQVNDLKSELEGTNSKLLEVSQQVAEGGGGGKSEARLSLGAAVLSEASDEIKAFVSNGASGQISITVQNAITTADGSAGGLIYHDEERTPVRMQQRRLRIRDLVAKGTTGVDLVKFRRQTLRTSAAGMVAEQGTFQASSYGWTKDSTQVRKIGHITHISEEAMSDPDQLQTELDTEMRYGLDLEEENQLLSGDNTGENLEGMITAAPAFAIYAGMPNQTRIDRLRQAILKIALEDHIAQAFVLNPADWAGIDLTKDSEGRYIFGNPFGQSTPMLWGKDVAECNSIAVNEWLAGDFMMAATLYDRQETEVLISSEHGDNFIEDMLTAKARKRLAFAIKRSLAMVKGNFTFP